MLYPEYFTNGCLHLSSIKHMLNAYKDCDGSNTKDKIILNIWYLSGYVMEGFTVYSFFKGTDWDRNENIGDIDNDIDFARNYGVMYNHGHAPVRICSHDWKKLIEDENDFRDWIQPLDDDTPYFGNGFISSYARKLIDNWNPRIRYYHRIEDYQRRELSFNSLSDLLETMQIIQKKIIDNIGI